MPNQSYVDNAAIFDEEREYRIGDTTIIVSSVFKDKESKAEFLDQIVERLLLKKYTKQAN